MYIQPWKPHECEELKTMEPNWDIVSTKGETIITYLTGLTGIDVAEIIFCPFCGKKLPEIEEGKTEAEFNPPEYVEPPDNRPPYLKQSITPLIKIQTFKTGRITL